MRPTHINGFTHSLLLLTGVGLLLILLVPERPCGISTPDARKLLIVDKQQHGGSAEDGGSLCETLRSSQTHGHINDSAAASIIRTMSAYPASKQNCRVFVQNLTDPLWIPWQPYQTIGKWSDNRECQSDLFCDTMFPLNETQHVASLIYAHQNPPDCSKVGFLINLSEWPSGLGSAIHVKSYVLLTAMKSGRVLVDAPGVDWGLTNPQTCPQKDWSCYFARLTKCVLPSNWSDNAVPFESAKGTERFVTVKSTTVFRETMRAPLRLFGYDHKPVHWWSTHASMYLFRPNQRTVNFACHAWNCMFPHGSGPSRPFAAIFIRSGDKFTEAKLHEPFEYFDLVMKLNRTLPEAIQTVYVGTDSARMLSQVDREFSHAWNLVYLGHHRSDNGNSQDFQKVVQHSARIEYQILSTLAELMVASSADISVGTLSSNQCRLLDEQRKIQGKARMPYLTPEGTLDLW